MRLESVGKRYGLRQPWVVRSVSLDVLPGQLIRLEGRNGSGNPPLLRHPGAAALATLAVVIVALAANVSPANAALRSHIASNTAARWPSAVSLIAAAALLAVAWTASAMAAARRERSLS